MNPLLGIALIAVGSIGAASFYVPFKKVKSWAWESYWIMQGVAAWLLAPWIFALLTVPDGTLIDILSDAPSKAKWLAIMFGAIWGIGGLTFGLTLRYLGIALGQSIALGLTAAFGTLIPPIVAGENLFASKAGILTVVGVAIALAGIAIIGYAGVLKDKNLSEEERKKAVKEFALKKGLLIALLAGVTSASFNYGLEAGAPINEVAGEYGTNPLFQTNPTLIFVLIGGFFTNFVYCVYLNIKNKTYTDYLSVSGGVFLNNVLFTFLAGVLWFMQFFFFGMGKSQLPEEMAIFGWSILMALNISLSNIWGLILKEWHGTGRKTIIILIIGIIILIASTFVVSIK
jgi:L-rhamnose-H+ transport protein